MVNNFNRNKKEVRHFYENKSEVSQFLKIQFQMEHRDERQATEARMWEAEIFEKRKRLREADSALLAELELLRTNQGLNSAASSITLPQEVSNLVVSEQQNLQTFSNSASNDVNRNSLQLILSRLASIENRLNNPMPVVVSRRYSVKFWPYI